MTKAERFTLPRTGKIHVALTGGELRLTWEAGRYILILFRYEMKSAIVIFARLTAG